MNRALLFLCFAALLSGCGDDGSTVDNIEFDTGDFNVTTTLVDDRCLDGGLNLLFMPNGDGTPWQWPFAIPVYNQGSLPKTYDIQLREPFGQMTVTATRNGRAGQVIVAQEDTGVLLGEATFGQCVVDMGATVYFDLLDQTSLSGVATLEMRDPRGDARCPIDMPATCEVILTFEATRAVQ